MLLDFLFKEPLHKPQQVLLLFVVNNVYFSSFFILFFLLLVCLLFAKILQQFNAWFLRKPISSLSTIPNAFSAHILVLHRILQLQRNKGHNYFFAYLVRIWQNWWIIFIGTEQHTYFAAALSNTEAPYWERKLSMSGNQNKIVCIIQTLSGDENKHSESFKRISLATKLDSI